MEGVKEWNKKIRKKTSKIGRKSASILTTTVPNF